ncbi:exodeoxyribonuclease VII large subunit [Aeromicrobium sp. CTD01-1L150]|uniref:exodeoxyribonuclease VII large subunit n=1 Tax=Aeromicrobium sp. CTD01-1L150 TaxID=3341830 RepID=UPI0035C0A9D1
MALQTSADAPAPLRQVSTLVGQYIDRLGAVWVEGEVAQLNRRPGLCFLTLRDLRATISVQATCHVSILDALPVPVAAGARVVVHAKPRFYEPNGAFSLDVREIRMAGEGELLVQLERRKQLLAAEGLFDPRLKRPLPFLPTAIGLVTGKDSAAEKDVLQTARLRWPGVRLEVRHALMQGAGSAQAVVAALRELDSAGDVDVVVIARGGGSMEDLLPFSDEALIRAVHACTVPVVSAIGHEPDTPILDLVADVRASTPTDAAKRVVPDAAQEQSGLTQARSRLAGAVARMLERETRLLEQIRSRPVLRTPTTLVEAQASLVDEQLSRARRAVGHRLDREHDAVGSQLARVRALSPLATLQRGYAVAQDADGHVIGSVADVPESFSVRLADGTADVHTTSTQEETHE